VTDKNKNPDYEHKESNFHQTGQSAKPAENRRIKFAGFQLPKIYRISEVSFFLSGILEICRTFLGLCLSSCLCTSGCPRPKGQNAPAQVGRVLRKCFTTVSSPALWSGGRARTFPGLCLSSCLCTSGCPRPRDKMPRFKLAECFVSAFLHNFKPSLVVGKMGLVKSSAKEERV
jgi:hypothetical protein